MFTVKENDNLSKTDRAVRLFVGPSLIAFGIWTNNWIACMGVWLFMTVFSGWCPVYSIFSFSTAPKKEEPKE